MIKLNNVKVVIFDFDGVILDSMQVRDFGFREIFKNYSMDKVEELIKYHRINGGLSRFHKIEYFYKNILNNSIGEEKIANYAGEFSEIMRKELINEQYLISEWIDFINDNHDKYIMHIASGSEEEELKYICENLGISKYFKSIHGSPTHKNELVKNIISNNNYNKEKIIMIGDSINDYEAAISNGIRFIGYNNDELQNFGDYYLQTVKI